MDILQILSILNNLCYPIPALDGSLRKFLKGIFCSETIFMFLKSIFLPWIGSSHDSK